MANFSFFFFSKIYIIHTLSSYLLIVFPFCLKVYLNLHWVSFVICFLGYFGSAGHSSLYSTPPPAQPPPPPHHYHSTPPSHQYHSIPPLPLVHSTPPPHQYHSPSLCPAAAPQHWGQISQLPPPIPSMTAEFTNFAKEWFIKR